MTACTVLPVALVVALGAVAGLQHRCGPRCLSVMATICRMDAGVVDGEDSLAHAASCLDGVQKHHLRIGARPPGRQSPRVAARLLQGAALPGAWRKTARLTGGTGGSVPPKPRAATLDIDGRNLCRRDDDGVVLGDRGDQLITQLGNGLDARFNT